MNPRECQTAAGTEREFKSAAKPSVDVFAAATSQSPSHPIDPVMPSSPIRLVVMKSTVLPQQRGRNPNLLVIIQIILMSVKSVALKTNSINTGLKRSLLIHTPVRVKAILKDPVREPHHL